MATYSIPSKNYQFEGTDRADAITANWKRIIGLYRYEIGNAAGWHIDQAELAPKPYTTVGGKPVFALRVLGRGLPLANTPTETPPTSWKEIHIAPKDPEDLPEHVESLPLKAEA